MVFEEQNLLSHPVPLLSWGGSVRAERGSRMLKVLKGSALVTTFMFLLVAGFGCFPTLVVLVEFQ